jgi:hypothetical protein
VVADAAGVDHQRMSLIDPYPWPIDGRLGDPDPIRRAARLSDARLAIEHSGPFAYQVVDLDHGPVGYRRTWSGAEELAHQHADLREAA